MRILVPTHFPLIGSGSGVYVDNLARQILRAGHDVHVIAPEHHPITGRPFPCTTILFAGGGAKRRDLPFNFPCFTTHPRSSNRFDALRPDEIAAYVEVFRKKISAAVADFRPHLIHAQHIWVTAFCAAQVGLPYVVTSHGTDLIGLKKDTRFRKMVETGAHNAARIIAISRQVAGEIKTLLGVAETKIALIGNGFDPAIFHPSHVDRRRVLTHYGLRPDFRYIVSFVGKLTEFKGVDVLIRAAALYESELEGTATLIIGDGELRGQLEALAAERSLKGVYFLRERRQDEVAELLRVSDLHTMPSRWEPFGIAALEALACGTPVVGTNSGGLPDFVTDEVGCLVGVDDPVQLAHAVIHEIRSEAKKMKGPAAARYALQHFTWEKQVGKILRLYEEVLAAS